MPDPVSMVDPSETSTPSSYLAPYFGEYVSDMLGRAQGLASIPYQEYTGNRFAGPSQLQQQAFTGLGGLTMPSYFSQAGDLYTQAANRIGSYTPETITAGQMGPLLDAGDLTTVNRFMSPYQQNVIDATKQKMWDDFTRGKGMRDSAAVKANAFGGDRHGLTEGVAWEGLQTGLQNTQYKGLQDAFTAAQDAINKQRAAQIQSGQIDINAALDAARANQSAGLNAYNTGIQGLNSAAGGLGALGTSSLTAQRGIFDSQLAGGATQQGFMQQPLDFGYQQWQESQAYPYQQLNFQRSMLGGLPLDVKPTAQPNALLEGIMGAGTLYSLLNGGT